MQDEQIWELVYEETGDIEPVVNCEECAEVVYYAPNWDSEGIIL